MEQSMSHVRIPKNIDEGVDQLSKMLELQSEFNKKFYEKSQMTTEDKVQWTKDLFIATVCELSELMNQIQYKWWKKKSEIDELEVAFELLDIQHFLNSFYDVWGLDYKMVSRLYEAKMKENHDRQKRGY